LLTCFFEQSLQTLVTEVNKNKPKFGINYLQKLSTAKSLINMWKRFCIVENLQILQLILEGYFKTALCYSP